MTYKIMIVEDDDIIVDVLKRNLEKWGYMVQPVNDFGHVLEEFWAFEPHLILMDINLPFYDGYHWCSQIRKTSKVPVIFISSASDDMNLVMAIHMGADDFIAKPFKLEVIVAKVQALLRRTYAFGAEPELLAYKGVALNINNSVLMYENHKIELTKNEFKIMQLLLENVGSIVSRDEIIRRLWESEAFIDDNTLTVNMNRLRKRLNAIGLEGFISTKKGVGYMIEEQE